MTTKRWIDQPANEARPVLTMAVDQNDGRHRPKRDGHLCSDRGQPSDS